MIRRFTFIAAALIVMTGSVAAQKRFVHKAAGIGTKVRPAVVETAVGGPAKVGGAANALYMPLHEEVWFYENGVKGGNGSTDYIYDTKGNVTKSTYKDEDGTTVTMYEYDGNNQWTEQRTYYYDTSGKLLTDQGTTGRKTRAFDSVVKDLVVESMEYMIAPGDGGTETWNIVDAGRTWRRDVIRDERGRLTSIEVRPYYGGDYLPMRRTTITYNEDGRPDTWKYEELDYRSNWIEVFLLTGMEWYRTDCQITVEDDFSGFFAPGNNRLKKANVREEGVDVGKMSATYDENGDYTYTFDYFATAKTAMSRDVFTVKYTDDNGSMTEENVYYEDKNGDGVLTDDEVQETRKGVATYNDKGEITTEEYYEDGEFTGGSKHEYVYGDYAYPQEYVMSQYDERTGRYLPFIKVVRSNYVDVAVFAGIESVAARHKGVAADGVYNLQGVRMAADAGNLPAGLYIVKRNGRTMKVVRR